MRPQFDPMHYPFVIAGTSTGFRVTYLPTRADVFDFDIPMPVCAGIIKVLNAQYDGPPDGAEAVNLLRAVASTCAANGNITEAQWVTLLSKAL